jgi:hypothetical protein
VATGSISGSIDVFNVVELLDTGYNYSEGVIEFSLNNTGESATESIDYEIEASGNGGTGSISNLDPGETGSFNLSITDPESVDSVQLDVSGPNFADSSSGVTCLPSEKLEAYWPLNDAQTENDWAVDVTEGNNGSIKDTTTTGFEGVIGEAYSFDGDNDRINGVGEWNYPASTAFWFRPNDNTASDKQIIATSGYSYNNNKGWMVVQTGSAAANGGGKVGVCIGTYCYTPYDVPVDEDEWNHIVVNIDSGAVVTVYRDGEQIAQRDYSENSGLEGDGFSLGARIGGANSLNGQLDDFRIYDRTLSETEIDSLYQARDKNWNIDACKLS